MRSSATDEYLVVNSPRRFSISCSHRVRWPLTEEYERRTASRGISDKSIGIVILASIRRFLDELVFQKYRLRHVK